MKEGQGSENRRLLESRSASCRIRLGISRCLLGDAVRYDGGHKHDRYLAEVLSRVIEWVPVCPEVEAGLGTPREPMQLVGTVGRAKLLTLTTRQDRTNMLESFSHRRISELKSMNLSGYVFKARSPSCGVEQVPLYDRDGNVTPGGTGLFAQLFRNEFPLIPVTDEGHLADPISRQHFLEQVFGYSRWQALMCGPMTRQRIARFHRREAEELQKRSPSHYVMLSRLVSETSQYHPNDLAARYGQVFMQALNVAPSTHMQAGLRHSRHQYPIQKDTSL
ncbi:MAG: DUF1722 domain-containing protein [Nitrospira sp.]|nr:DUF1722 domain-containing protein [Nitrospira sp.]MBH0195571.1 DUF1722 domain-containing protein [Nitrospira sp.]